MKIFVTGATGYIGKKLVYRLLEQGHEVRALCRKRPTLPEEGPCRLTCIEGDLLNMKAIRQAMEGCEQAYHVAAYARVWSQKPSTFFDVNVTGTNNVLEAAVRSDISKLVFTSTGGTLGVSNGKPLDETSLRTVDFFTAYESSKFVAETLVERYSNRGLDATIVQPCRVYGPGVWTESNALTYLIKAYVTGEWHVIPGDGRFIGNFSFVDDVVEGHLAAMERGRSGERYILGGEDASFAGFLSLVRKLSSRDFLLLKVPLPLVMTFAWKEEVFAKWFGKEPLITRGWIRKYRHDMAFSSHKAISELGYKITPLEEGILQTLEWLRTEERIYF